MAKRKWGVNAHTDEFQQDASGKYVYTGNYYAWQPECGSRTRAMVKLILYWIASFALIVAAGCVPDAGMEDRAYIIIPYAVQIIASVSVGWGAFRLAFAGDPLMAYVYDETAASIPIRAMITIVGAGLTCLGEVFNLILNGSESPRSAAVLLIAEAASLILTILIRRSLQKMSWKMNSKGQNNSKNA